MVFFLPCWSFPLSLFCTLLSLCQTCTHTHSSNLLAVWLENAHRPLLSPLQNVYLPCLLVQCHLQRSAEPGTEKSSQPYRGMTFKCKFNLNNRGDRQTARGQSRNALVQTYNTILQASQEYSGKVEKLIRFICHRHAREELYLCVGVCISVWVSALHLKIDRFICIITNPL